jgi:RsiW-degrading membrane proteinase PrsW (M82 family)
MKAPDNLAGKRARCPKCKSSLTVPTPDVEEDCGYEVVDEGVSNASNVPVPAPDSTPTFHAVRNAGADVPMAPAAEPPNPVRRPPRARPKRAASSPWRDRAYWVLALTLIPLAVSFLSTDDTEERLNRTRDQNQQLFQEADHSRTTTLDDVLNALPGSRIDGAHLPRGTWVHWGYAALSATFFLSLTLLLFRSASVSPITILLIGLFTGTIGIMLLLGLQWAAMASQGVWLRGRALVMIAFYIIKFIGFSYAAALDPRNGFLLSCIGFTCGVGFCEELFKAVPVIVAFRRREALDWRSACIWGLASGVGFGVSEGITYSSDYYNGISTWGIYAVRFVSCVALHAIWSASVGILIYRNRAWLQGDMDWTDWFQPLARFLGIAMILHGLYDTMLKRDMNLGAMIIAIGSLAWLAWLIERTRTEEAEEEAGALARA